MRQLTIKPPKTAKNTPSPDTMLFVFNKQQAHLRSPKLWLIPASCLDRLSSLANCMIAYLFSAGHHIATLPDLQSSCLVKLDSRVLFDLGPEERVSSLNDLLLYSDDQIQEKRQTARKRKLELTPRKNRQRKRFLTSTPKKLD